MKALELFCGMGGFAAAAEGAIDIVGAIDLSPHVLEIYRHNYPTHGALQAQLDTFAASKLMAYEADMWWMSPPCQPYTTRGIRKDLSDNRARSLVHVLSVIGEHPPDFLGMENVPGFIGSEAHDLLTQTLERAGYQWRERVLCPTALGIPARRERYYLVASRKGLREVEPDNPEPRLLETFLDGADVDEALFVPDDIVAVHGPGMRVLDLSADPDAIANTFTGAYGKTWQAAGAYLRDPSSGRVRRFSPREMLRIMGFPESFDFPAHTPLRHRYKAIGNSLSVFAMKEILRPMPWMRP
jgi:DNA (cytosine-5)-methyltransferase 1